VSDPIRLFPGPDPTLEVIPDPDPTLQVFLDPILDPGHNPTFFIPRQRKKKFLKSFRGVKQ